MKDKITFKEDYYINGQLMHKSRYLNGKRHGEQIGYYSNGKLRYKFQFPNGEKHGEQIGYWDDGKLSYKSYYIKGDEVSEEEWLEYNTPQHHTQFLTDMYV